MTFEAMFKKVQKAVTAVDASAVADHIAVQVNVLGESEGAFYIEIADGKLSAEPYDYNDRDFMLTAEEAVVLDVAAGKLSLEAGIAEQKMQFEGNYDKAMALNAVLAQLPVKKTRQTTAKAAGKTEKVETPAEKPAAKRNCKAKTAADAKPAAKTKTEKKPAAKKPGRKPKASK